VIEVKKDVIKFHDKISMMQYEISIEKKTERRKQLLVGMMWVGVGFRFENPHQAGLGFSDENWVDVGFTVGF
jgi:hypothetical protein